MASLAAWPRRSGSSISSWIPACRMAAAGVLAIAILTARWFPGPQGPPWARLAGLAIAALLVIVGLSSSPRAAPPPSR